MAVSGSDAPSTYIKWRGNAATHILATVAAGIWRWNGDRAGQIPLLGRFTAHLALILGFGLLLAGVNAQAGSAHRVAPNVASLALSTDTNASALVSEPVDTLFSPRPYHNADSRAQVVRYAQPHTAIPERPRLEIVTYIVQVGDTTESIAAGFGLQPTTIMWSNPEIEKAPDLLKVGQQLTILPLDGVYHTVAEGDSLGSIIEKYKASLLDVVNCPFNKFPMDDDLPVGMKIIVPNGTKPFETRKVTTYEGPAPAAASGLGVFYWPASGTISQGYWWGHRAIDIAHSVGAAIVASDSGYISFAGWTDIGYGYLIVVDHANGYQTYYAHLSNMFVVEGEVVSAGQVIGAMGNTGNSTGPHLHFEVRYNGYPTNPWIYLP